MNKQLLEGAKEGDLDLMREALRNGADVNTRNREDRNDSSTPFIMACRHGRLEATRFLSSVPGIDLNAFNKSFNRKSIGNTLTAFHYACGRWCGQLEMVRFLSSVPGVNFHAVAERGIYKGSSGLHLAAQRGNLPVVQFLLSSDLGFDMEARNNDGRSALCAAFFHDHLHVAKYLLTTHNADVLTIDRYGKSVYTWPSKGTAAWKWFGICWKTTLTRTL